MSQTSIIILTKNKLLSKNLKELEDGLKRVTAIDDPSFTKDAPISKYPSEGKSVIIFIQKYVFILNLLPQQADYSPLSIKVFFNIGFF